ncbi:MAG: hypothetical protein E7E25_08420 [Fusobacterium periodonticum]|jgi:hypothetical protein|nr:hypothetical protein [Fusobacterium periodonticum]
MKNYALEFTDNEWTLYHYDEELNNLPDIKGTEINQYFNVPDLSSLEDEYTSINAYWDSDEQAGYIDIEITAVHSDSTYPFKTKYYDFSKFLKDLKDLENEIEIDKLNVNDWEYEKNTLTQVEGYQ